MAAHAPSPSSSSAGAAASASPFELVDAQSCSLCMDPFATAADGHSISSDRRPRVLSCGHSFCGSCLHLDMQRRRCCATCRAPIAHADAAAVPVNFELIASLQAAEGAAKQMAALQMQVDHAHAAHRQAVAHCAECDQPAAHFCEQCGDDLCGAHSSLLHSLKKFQGHNVVAIADKAVLVAAIQKREAKARANKCALHPDQIKYLYCDECNEAVCAVCAQGRHAAHGKIEIAEAAAQVRKRFQNELEFAGDGPAKAHGAVAGLVSLADVDTLRTKIREMQTELQSSSAQAQSDLDALTAELTVALQRLHAVLTEQLGQQTEDAAAALANLLSAADRAAAEGAQLRAAAAAAAACDDHEALAAAPSIVQLCAAMRDHLRRLGAEVAAAAGSGVGGCVSALRLESDTKAATLSALAQLGKVTQQRTKIALNRNAAVNCADGSLRQLDSRVLPAASDATLLEFFGDNPVPARLLYRASRDGFRSDDWKAKCADKGPTMTLVQVRRLQAHTRGMCCRLWTVAAMESGYVFGAYSHSQWPKNGKGAVVEDPSGHSFLFSLTNEANQAVRLSLHRKSEAFGMSSHGGFRFGWSTTNFALSFNGKAADDAKGNTAWPLNKDRAYLPDDGDMERDADFFAGSEWFAAADIEVYEL